MTRRGAGRAYSESVGALHLTDVPHRRLFDLDDAELSEAERQFAGGVRAAVALCR